MNEPVKKTPAKPANTAKTPKTLVPRTAPKAAPPAAAPQAEAAPPLAKDTPATAQAAAALATAPAAPPAAAPAAKKPRAPRKPTAVEATVAKHQKVLADALSKAQAINYDQPKVMKQAAPKTRKTAKAEKAPKAKKIKLVRDSFTMPKTEYVAIDALKARAARLGRPAKKSEMLRAGVQALTAMTDAQFLACVSAVPAIKTGRPAKPKA